MIHKENIKHHEDIYIYIYMTCEVTCDLASGTFHLQQHANQVLIRHEDWMPWTLGLDTAIPGRPGPSFHMRFPHDNQTQDCCFIFTYTRIYIYIFFFFICI